MQTVQVPLNFMLNPGQGPDGKTWAVLGVQSGGATFQVAMDPEGFYDFAEKIPAELNKLAAIIKRANLGIVIAPNLDVLNKNGRKP